MNQYQNEYQTYLNKIDLIKSHPVYQQILKDSFGGVLYNVANHNKYQTKSLLKLWSNLTPIEKDSVDGIMRGAFNFITSK